MEDDYENYNYDFGEMGLVYFGHPLVGNGPHSLLVQYMRVPPPSITAARSPCTSLDGPRANHAEPYVLSQEDMRLALEAIANHAYTVHVVHGEMELRFSDGPIQRF